MPAKRIKIGTVFVDPRVVVAVEAPKARHNYEHGGAWEVRWWVCKGWGLQEMTPVSFPWRSTFSEMEAARALAQEGYEKVIKNLGWDEA